METLRTFVSLLSLYDPEAQDMSEELGRRAGDTKWFEVSKRIKELMIHEKEINANVDFYPASAYYVLGIPIDLYPLIFAVSRISGWTAHVLEQYANNKLIRPLAEYAGPAGLRYVSLDQRRAKRGILVSGHTPPRHEHSWTR